MLSSLVFLEDHGSSWPFTHMTQVHINVYFSCSCKSWHQRSISLYSWNSGSSNILLQTFNYLSHLLRLTKLFILEFKTDYMKKSSMYEYFVSLGLRGVSLPLLKLIFNVACRFIRTRAYNFHIFLLGLQNFPPCDINLKKLYSFNNHLSFGKW